MFSKVLTLLYVQIAWLIRTGLIVRDLKNVVVSNSHEIVLQFLWVKVKLCSDYALVEIHVYDFVRQIKYC